MFHRIGNSEPSVSVHSVPTSTLRLILTRYVRHSRRAEPQRTRRCTTSQRSPPAIAEAGAAPLPITALPPIPLTLSLSPVGRGDVDGNVTWEGTPRGLKFGTNRVAERCHARSRPHRGRDARQGREGARGGRDRESRSVACCPHARRHTSDGAGRRGRGHPAPRPRRTHPHHLPTASLPPPSPPRCCQVGRRRGP